MLKELSMPTEKSVPIPPLQEQRYDALVQGSGDIVSRYKPDGTLMYVSERYCLFFERSEQELLGRTIFDFLDRDMHDGTKKRLSMISRQTPVIEGQNVIIQKHGGPRSVEWTTSGIFDDKGNLIEFQSVGRDVTEFNDTREQLSMSELRHRQAVDIAGLGYWVWDEYDDRLAYCSEHAASIYGTSVDQALQRSSTLQGNLQVVHQDDRERYNQVIFDAANNLTSYDITFKIVRPDGQLRFLRELAEPRLDLNGKLYQTLGTIQDVTERELAAQKIARMARYDTLTDLPNRSLFFDRLETGIRSAARDRKPLAVLFVDLDGFKPINDTYGHQIGDDLLVEIAKRMNTCVRASDTVGRYGGDEFVALLGGDMDAERSSIVAGKILEEVSRPININGTTLNVGASIGIAIFPTDGKSSEELMAAADAAMYDVKRNGKGGFRQVSHNT